MNNEVLELECRLRFIDLCASNMMSDAPTGMDLFIEGFWAAADAMRHPRDSAELQTLLSLARARAEGLIK